MPKIMTIEELFETRREEFRSCGFSPEEIRDKLKTIMGETINGRNDTEIGDDGLDF